MCECYTNKQRQDALEIIDKMRKNKIDVCPECGEKINNISHIVCETKKTEGNVEFVVIGVQVKCDGCETLYLTKGEELVKHGK